MPGSVGQRVRQLRTARGLTLAQLAALAGTDAPSLSRLESGQTDVRLSTVQRIAAALNTSPGHLLTEAPMPVQTQTGQLTVSAVAADLGVAPLAVKRLIARRRLKAVRLGPDGEWRIAAAEVARYIEAGAPDFAFPETDGPWLAGVRSADGFAQSIRDAADEQIPDEAPAVREGQAVPIQLTAAVLAVIQGPPRGPFGVQIRTPFVDWRVAYLADLVRKAAYQTMRVSLQPPLQRLYDTPDAYTRILAEAAPQVLSGAISMSKQYLVDVAPGVKEWRPFQFELTHQRLAAGRTWALVLEQAF